MTMNVISTPKIHTLKPWQRILQITLGLVCVSFPDTVLASEAGSLKLVESWVGITALILFVTAYVFVVVEEFTQGWSPKCINPSRFCSLQVSFGH